MLRSPEGLGHRTFYPEFFVYPFRDGFFFSKLQNFKLELTAPCLVVGPTDLGGTDK